MNHTVKTCFRITLLSALALLYAAQAFAVRPFLADDAETVKPLKGVVEIKGTYNTDEETSGRIKERSSNEFEVKAVTGLYKHIDLTVIASGVVEEREKEDSVLIDRKRDGWNDLIVESKYNFLEYEGFLFTAKPTFFIPIGTNTNSKRLSDGKWGFGGTLIASKTFAEKYTLIANASYLRHNYSTAEQKDERRSDIWNATFAAEAEVLHNLKVVADFSVATNQDRRFTSELLSYALVGFEYEVCRNFGVFTAGKFGLTKPSIDMAALYGISIKF